MLYKGYINERSEDAPFIGALIIANDCHHNCYGCCNQELKLIAPYNETAEHIIKQVKADIFNKGIILAGLEWTEQPDDLRALYWEAQKQGLEVMIYTHLTVDEFMDKFKDICKHCYVKFGEYKQDAKTDYLKLYDVKLATANQYIIKFN
ncbi:hypothetical protein phiCTP1_gp47 [Clostridium phage phiCTP1]|uniref:hypothetical protein n=1 Tax=Clostridium phage phiCTP1 TaxID=871584 RepID=UPI0001E07840|nr:hypothetical protein phiCTP1_gp47 [Clostridium phage phiCTP1]ADL40348.1 hypothetical phage protein [Clostridium phage phiCTP1]WMU07979.1 hypothetical protein vBCtySFA88_00047 [Clostridium phage vB_CtyS-FA88]